MPLYLVLFNMGVVCALEAIFLRCDDSYYAVKIYIGKDYLDFELKTSYDVWWYLIHIETNQMHLNTQGVTDKFKEIIHDMNDHYISDIDIDDPCYYGRVKGYQL